MTAASCLLPPIAGAGAVRCIPKGSSRPPCLSALRVLQKVALAELDARLASARGGCRCTRRLVLNIFLDLFRHGDKGLLHVDGVLGRGLQKGDLKVTGELRALLRAHLSYLLHVTLVSHEYLAHARVCKSLNLMHPLPHVVERVAVSHIVDDYNAVRAPVVAACECAEPFLAGGVPYLKFHYLFFQLDGFDLEIHSNRVEEVLVERIFLISKY